MSHQKKKARILIIIVVFTAYFFIAARPIPRESVLVPRWISSHDASAESQNIEGQLIPFMLGSRFGYVDLMGNFAVNRVRQGEIYLSNTLWTEHAAEPSVIEIRNTAVETVLQINNPGGYPILLDNRIFILGSEQNALSEIDRLTGNVLWTFEFGAPLTSIDAAAGLVVTGSIDGTIEVINSQGRRIFHFEPGGSRYSIILGTAISSTGSHIGIISGIDQQRFLLLERFGNGGDYRVIFHEFLGDGFRRPVRIAFIDQDRRLVFERPGGLGSYNARSRQVINIPLEGKIVDIDNSGDQGFLFLITSHSSQAYSPQRKELIGIRFPHDTRMSAARLRRVGTHNLIFLRAPFRSNDFFLGRNDSVIIAGGGSVLVSFDLEEK